MVYRPIGIGCWERCPCRLTCSICKWKVPPLSHLGLRKAGRPLQHGQESKKLEFVKINGFLDGSPADWGWVSHLEILLNGFWRFLLVGGWSPVPLHSFASFMVLFMLDRFLCAIWMWVTWTERLVPRRWGQ